MSQSSSSSSSSTEEEEEEEVRPPPPKKPVAPPPAPPRNLSKPSAAGAGPKPKPPTPSSSEDEDDDEAEESSGGDDDSSSDTDGNSAKSPPPPPKRAAPTPTEPSDSGSADDSGSDDDSASSDHPSQPTVPLPPIKPPTSKPPGPKPDDKKLKVEETSSPKRHPLIWSDEDEIALLRGMVEYRLKTGRVPSYTDMDAFCEFVNKSLNVEATKTQLWSKVRRLRMKYVTAAAQGEDGDGPYLSKAHDRAAFELSKQIWPLKIGLSENGVGDEHGEDDAIGKDRKVKDEQVEAIKKQNHIGDSSSASALEDYDMMEVKCSDPLFRQAASYTASKKRPAYIAMEAVEMVDPSKAAMIKEKYKKLILSEMRHNLQRMELLKESAKLFMDAIEKMD